MASLSPAPPYPAAPSTVSFASNQCGRSRAPAAASYGYCSVAYLLGLIFCGDGGDGDGGVCQRGACVR